MPPKPPPPPPRPVAKAPDHPAKAEAIFIEALLREKDARPAFVSEACGGDDELASRVMGMLASEEPSISKEDPEITPELEAELARLKPEESGDRIGAYKLLQEIGEGGFGSVWLAEQDVPVKRRVALKIIKLGLDTKEVIARFEQERQALALMDHPNIAKVFDAGTTQWGRPFFVMELIRGVRITDFCDQEGLGVAERLGLFIEVCRAVQHAHQKGIIHRDIKPSNILVAVNDGRPIPKVIDFGVAKAMQGRLTEKTLFTMFDQMVGTPTYMSPEQAELTSLDIDTRSDIYSLGVVLYELLTGRTPIDAETIDRLGIDKFRQIIREVDPPRPSARIKTLGGEELTTAAKRRHVEPAKLLGMIRGDLDWIVMKCIEKDRKRRYDAADGLILDIQRHLANEPVLARPPTYRYRIGRFIRRNKLMVGAAGAVGVALITGAVISRAQALRAIAERDAKDRALNEAREAEADTKAFGDFLVKRVLAAARPEDVEGGLGIDVSVVRALEQSEKRLEQDFAGRPRAEAVAREAIGVTWGTLGRYAEAAKELDQALKLREQAPRVDESAVLKTVNDLAVVYQKAGASDKALLLYEKVLARRKATLPTGHPDILLSMNNLAGAYFDTGDVAQALTLYEQTFEAAQSTLGPDNEHTLKSMSNLARAWKVAGKENQDLPLKALPLYIRAFKQSELNLGADHPDTLTCMNNLAVCYEQAGESEKALPLFDQALTLSRKKLGDDHPDTVTSMNNLAGLYFRTNQTQKAVVLYEEALTKGRGKPGADHPDTINSMANLAVAYEKANELSKAIPLYREVLERRTSKLGLAHRDTLRAMNNLAVAYTETGDLDKALPLFEETAMRRKALLGQDAPDTLKSMFNLALAYRATKQFGKSLAQFEELLAARAKRFGTGDPERANLEQQVREVRQLANP